MAQEFGNVKGFSDALSYLDDEEKAHLLSLITDKDMLMQEAQDRHIFCEPPKKWMASFALAVIYHANNGAE